MFEDSTFESSGRIRTRSRRWMIAVFLFNTSILLALVLIPLLCPQALPHQAMLFLVDAPMPVAQQPPTVQPTAPRAGSSTPMDYDQLRAPRIIPRGIVYIDRPEAPMEVAVGGPGPGVQGAFDPPWNGPVMHPVVRPAVRPALRVSTAIEEGLIVLKTPPIYPPIAKAAHVEGTVILAATISRTGTIENLRATAGPVMLQQAALDAVRTWRYRPYLLDGDPVEVETTVNVIFMLSR
ncbi:MAG: energy transducer TonB [Terracidiphilus sp.]|jgi:protein TonB